MELLLLILAVVGAFALSPILGWILVGLIVIGIASN